MSGTAGMLFNSAGQMIFAPNGRGSSGTIPGIRFGAATDHCCTPWYVQAKKCADGTLVDLWFPYVCDPGPPIVCQVQTPNIGNFDLPFYFRLVGDDTLTNYVVPAQPAKCAHGTLAGDVLQIHSCGKCENCFESDAPAALNVTFGDIEIYLHATTAPGDGRDVRFDSDLAAIPDVCLCQIADCSWSHREVGTSSVTIKSRNADGTDNTRTVPLDIVYVAGRGTLGTGSGGFYTSLFVYAVVADPSLMEVTNGTTFALFAGVAFYDNCGDTPTLSNEILDYGPFAADLHPSAIPWPPTTFTDHILPAFYCRLDGGWCATNLPLDFPLGTFQQRSDFYVGRSGDATLSPSGAPCAWAPLYKVTLIGTVPRCDGTHKGRTTVDGVYGDTSDTLNPDGIGINADYAVNSVDRIDEFSGDPCTGGIVVTRNAPGFIQVSVNHQLGNVFDSSTVQVIVEDDGSQEVWRGQVDDFTFDSDPACGYPKVLHVPWVDRSPNGYQAGYALLELRNEPS